MQKGFAGVLVLLVVVIIVAVGGYLYLQQNKQGRPSTETVNVPSVKKDLPSFIYYVSLLYWQEGDKTTHIYSFDPNSKQEKEILSIPTTKEKNLSRISLSPDHKRVAYSLFEQTVIGTGAPNINRQLWLVNTDGTNNKMIFEDKSKGEIIHPLIWSPDSKYLIFINNYKEAYKVSVEEGKVDKMADPLSYRLTGWFTNNKLGFEQAKPTGCPPEDECYPAYQAILTNTDGSEPTVVYDPPKDYDPLTGYSWLRDGSGIVKADRKAITHFDFASKKETEIIKFAPKESGSLIIFPKTNSALVSIRSGESITEAVTLYKLDLVSDKLSKVKTYNESVDVISVSGDEKYYLIKYGNKLQGNTAYPIEKGLEVYDMTGNLVSETPYKWSVEPLGFTN